jgi:serine phosphatase RsbU (regulator of sigma subunit)/anti-sigma regulatory factor (Ser/Thr protein kinase)
MSLSIAKSIRNLIGGRTTTVEKVRQTERHQSIVTPAVEIPTSDPLYAYCLNAHGVVEVDTLKLHSPALHALREADIRILIPMVHQGEIVGMLQLGKRLSEQEYTSDDLRLLGNLAPQAATAMRVAQLAYQQQVEARRRERIEQEMRVAGIIQQTLLPKEVPTVEGYSFAAYWQPARAVGGDFYDFVRLDDSRLMITIGDVTDKGVPAALVMASTRTILRAAAERLMSPGEILRRANDVLHPDMPPKMFATCLCAVLDTRTGRMMYANAGHNAALQKTKDGVIELRARGMPLGLMPGMTYEEKETVLAPDDTIFMYSDGLVEAHDPQREMFGMKRLHDSVHQHSGGEMLISHLRDALFEFAGGDWEQEDDVTFVVIQRVAGGAVVIDDQWRVLDSFEVASTEGGERAVMERVAKAVQAIELPSARIERLKTAVAEATMNAMEHGNRYQAHLPVKIEVKCSASELVIRVTDFGGEPPSTHVSQPNLEAKLAGEQSPRGWGLFLIRAMVDDLQTHTHNGEHTIELIMKLEGMQHV